MESPLFNELDAFQIFFLSFGIGLLTSVVIGLVMVFIGPYLERFLYIARLRFFRYGWHRLFGHAAFERQMLIEPHGRWCQYRRCPCGMAFWWDWDARKEKWISSK